MASSSRSSNFFTPANFPLSFAAVGIAITFQFCLMSFILIVENEVINGWSCASTKAPSNSCICHLTLFSNASSDRHSPVASLIKRINIYVQYYCEFWHADNNDNRKFHCISFQKSATPNLLIATPKISSSLILKLLES